MNTKRKLIWSLLWLVLAIPVGALALAYGGLVDTGIALTIVSGLAAFFALDYQLRKHAQRERTANQEQMQRERVAREMEMRRDIYLSAVESISDAISHVLRFSDAALPHEKHQSMVQDMPKRISKVHVVGDQRMVRAVLAFQKKFTTVTMELATHRMELMRKKELREHWRSRLAFWDSVSDSSWKERGPLTEREMQSIVPSSKDAAKKFQEHDFQLLMKILEVAKLSTACAHKLLPEYIEVNLAARKELEFHTISPATYERDMNQWGQELFEANASFIEKFEANLHARTGER